MVSSAVLYRAADLHYDPATHTTVRPDGVQVPHVTAVLAEVGVSQNFEVLARTGGRMAEVLEHARARGTAVHADCHAYDDGDLDWHTVDDRVLPYLDAWVQVRRDKGLMPLARERHIYDPYDVFTGITDGVFDVVGRTVLADLKNGDPDDAAAHLQTAAYELGWTHEHPDIPIHERWAIWLRPGRRIPYTIINYTAAADAYEHAGKWRACLCVYREQAQRRARVR